MMNNNVKVRTREKVPRGPKQSIQLQFMVIIIAAAIVVLIISSPADKAQSLLPNPLPTQPLETLVPEVEIADSSLDSPHSGVDALPPVDEVLGEIDPQTGVVDVPLRTVAKEAVRQVVVLSNPKAMFPTTLNVGEDPESIFIKAFVSGNDGDIVSSGKTLRELGLSDGMGSYLVKVAKIRMSPDDLPWFGRTYNALANGLGRKDLADELAQEYAEHLASTYFSPTDTVSQQNAGEITDSVVSVNPAPDSFLEKITSPEPPTPPSRIALQENGLETDIAPLEEQAALAFNPTPGKILEQLRQLWMLLQSQSPGGQIQHVIGAYQKDYVLFGMQYLILAADPATEWDGSESWTGTDSLGRAWWRIGVVWKHQPPGFALGDSFNPKTLAQTLSDLPFVP